MMRLHKFIAQVSSLSRRAAERAIADGEVRVNGKRVTEMGVQVDPAKDRVTLAGKRLRTVTRFDYVALHKPRQVIVSKSDPQGRKTLWDLLPEKFQHVSAAGRLDFESEGLIILSNDGDFVQRLTHPSMKLSKVYRVKVQGRPSRAALDRMCEGIRQGGELLVADHVTRLRTTDSNTWIEVELHEGKNRQIRRMCDAIEHPVLKLKRTAIGEVRLGTLRSGESRRLTANELRSLQRKKPPTK